MLKLKHMKKLNTNPLVWFFVVVILGYFIIGDNRSEGFIVFILAVILAKQIEIINLNNNPKNN